MSPAAATLAAAVERHADRLRALSRSIHAAPELAFAEHRSAAKVADLAEAEGFEVERGVAGLDTTFTATYGAGELVIGLCAEYDTLPELGHACGHNIITASSAGAALALREIADRLNLTIKLIGTPAEESDGGKVLLVQRGVFDDVAMAMAMMVHPAPEETRACTSLAITDLQLLYTGKAAHAAFAPHKGRNAADALTVAQVAVGLLRQHLEDRQMLHGIVTHGGAAPNIVPANTSALYYLQAPDVEPLQQLEIRVRACFEAGALATGCAHEVTQVAPIYTDPWLAAGYRVAITGLGRSPLSPEDERDRSTGSIDMGNVTRALPAIHPTIAIDCGDAVNHQPEFATACATPSADRAVCDGALALALTGLAAATDDAQRERLIGAQRERLIGGVSRRPVAPVTAAGGAV